MSEIAQIVAAIYLAASIIFTLGLCVQCFEGDGRHHWTRPFAGVLWPIMAIIGIWIIWEKRYE
jgi:hypothetical protein